MKLPAFDYAAPASLQEAMALLRGSEDAKLISGGQSLMPMMAFRLLSPALLVDLRAIGGLSEIAIDADGVHLGARVRWCDILGDARLAAAHPLLRAAIGHVAHYQIRNRGTVGGSLAHADPAAELPAVAIACDGIIEIATLDGPRRVAARDFFTGPMSTVLAEDEIIIALHLPPWPRGRLWGFQEFSRRAGDFALAGICAFFDMAQGQAVDGHIAVFGAGDAAVRLSEAEAALDGTLVHMSEPMRSSPSPLAGEGREGGDAPSAFPSPHYQGERVSPPSPTLPRKGGGRALALDAAIIEDIAAVAAASAEVNDDVHAGAAYRRALIAAMTERALTDALARKDH